MRKRLPALLLALLLSLLAGCGAAPGGAGGPEGRVITDMAGRTVTVPEEIASAFPTDPTAGIYLWDTHKGEIFTLSEAKEKGMKEGL